MSKQKPSQDSPSDWRILAIESESDQRILKVLREGPKQLTDAWLLSAMKWKYDR